MLVKLTSFLIAISCLGTSIPLAEPAVAQSKLSQIQGSGRVRSPLSRPGQIYKDTGTGSDGNQPSEPPKDDNEPPTAIEPTPVGGSYHKLPGQILPGRGRTQTLPIPRGTQTLPGRGRTYSIPGY